MTRDLTGRRVHAEEVRSRFDALHGAGRGVDGAAADSENTLAPSPRAPTVGGSGARRIHSPVGIDVSMYRWFSVLYGSESNLYRIPVTNLYVLIERVVSTKTRPSTGPDLHLDRHGHFRSTVASDAPRASPSGPRAGRSAVLGYHIPASSSGSAHACACSCHVSRAWESDVLRCVGPRPLA